MKREHKRWWSLLFRGVMIGIGVYLVLATSLMFWIAYDIHNVNLSLVEPANHPVVRPLGDIIKYKPGKYGKANPFAPVLFEGLTPETTINRAGLRCGFEIGPSLGEYIGIIGDSFTFGYGLDDHETLTAYLAGADPGNKYVNLGQPTFNLHDSVTRYLSLRDQLKQPKVVLLQVLVDNDIASDETIRTRVHQATVRSSAYRLPPFNTNYVRDRIHDTLMNQIWRQVWLDLDKERFEAYIAGAITRLRLALPVGTPLVILHYRDDPAEGMVAMSRRLKAYCAQHKLPLWDVKEMVGAQVYNDARLSDGHPAGRLNQALARAMLPRLKALGSMPTGK